MSNVNCSLVSSSVTTSCFYLFICADAVVKCDIIDPCNYNDNWDCCDCYVVDSYINETAYIGGHVCLHENEPVPYISLVDMMLRKEIARAYEADRAGRPIWDRMYCNAPLSFWRDIYL